ncbi:hypothetical protein ASG37_08030 [Sphingomonas sp. Leaf407]|uniref:hypothetical protein n=1 Tax=unclassified Sphingomonas TaxID=196159 RepID=UPI0006F36DF9|nr:MULTISPECIES: hypothetical protein [unclassified Sphingomonas]KQN39495.1 hypothetical protein ASE97_05320 [Sphingomonas sp. Leaf42]KQT28772.1 hypothetical protein ASG37_08030 [Sphingomonas sp. Leaf407]
MMASAELTLAALVERLRTLAADDRRAILDTLPPAERRRIAARIDDAAPSPYGPAIAARIAACTDDDAMTPAAREALARAARRPDTVAVVARGPTLFDRMVGRTGARRS